MLGKWYTVVPSQVGKLILKFTIQEHNDSIAIELSTEPFPLGIAFDRVSVEGNRIIATGKANVMEEVDVSLELHFTDNLFSGSLVLPPSGTITFDGQPGEGPPLSEELIQELEVYRKNLVIERTDAEIAEEVEKLLRKMSIEDKIGQMSQCLSSNYSFGDDIASEPSEKLVEEGKAGSILGAFDIERVFELQRIAVEKSPHRIPLLFNADIIHGHQTIFPVPLAWSCSWDIDGIRSACVVAAKEASASGITYNHGPMVDITRDPRWGRVVEGAGEDPYLSARIAEAQVQGFQGDSLFSQETIIACLKHFIGYGAGEGGRDYNTVDMSEGTLRNVYLPPFQAGIEAGAGSVMNSFNIYQGVPVAGSKLLLKDLLRDELGFDGILISDYGAIDEIRIHGCAEDGKEAARMALEATMDIEMVTRAYADHLPQLIKDGVLKEEQLDDSVRRILTYKYKIGIMDDPFRYIRPEKEKEYHFSPDHLQESRELARKSIVLLKNDGVLPLSPASGKVAVVGPFAKSKDLLGPWQFSRYGNETITLEQGLRDIVGIEDLLVTDGCLVDSQIEGGIEEAVRMAKEADVVILALGESSNMSGEAASRMEITLPDIQRKLAEEIVNLGKPTVLVLTNGRPIVLDWFDQHVNAIVETWFLGSQAGCAIADVLYGLYNPSGKLTMSFPTREGQIPVYYNHFNTGRPVTVKNKDSKYISKYLDGTNEPLYPFGYGLSYTTFEYSEPVLNKTVMTASDTLTVQVNVRNTGTVAGEEIVQLYIQDLVGSVVRPVKELKGFQKIALQPGESKTVVFMICEEDLKYFTAEQTYKAETGHFHVYVGSSSRNVKQAKFTLI
ncbi:glycoside hydrolase family 3 N-terminal domain-containing protein [Paenibacillus sp. YIM B09110]|uniref:glycoside hydrolase family 3 N-terminal domain-containing protein n=1 Tax=Paenibacillus sp. YIM B09110 TaxID=3126102 RepID=UPI00301CBAF3